MENNRKQTVVWEQCKSRGYSNYIRHIYLLGPFESSVNPEGIQTLNNESNDLVEFESSVNPEGIQTFYANKTISHGFESSVSHKETAGKEIKIWRTRK